MDDGIAVGYSFGQMKNLYRLAVVEFSSAETEEGVAGPSLGCDGFERLHAVLHVLLRDDGCSDTGIRELAGKERAHHAGIESGSSHFHVATRVVAAKAGIHNELDGLLADFADRGDDFIRELPSAGVHNQRSLVAYLDGDIAAI